MALAAAIGMGIQTFATIGAGFDRARGMEAQAESQRREAKEVELKAIRDEIRLRAQGAEFVGNQGSASSRGGVTSSGSPLASMMDTLAKVEQEAWEIKHASKFRASQLRESAFSYMQSAQDSKVGGLVGGFGGLLTSIGSLHYSMKDPNLAGAAAGAGAASGFYGSSSGLQRPRPWNDF